MVGTALRLPPAMFVRRSLYRIWNRQVLRCLPISGIQVELKTLPNRRRQLDILPIVGDASYHKTLDLTLERKTKRWHPFGSATSIILMGKCHNE